MMMKLQTYDLNKADLKRFITLYQQRVYAFIVYLLGGAQDTVYEICARSFAQAMGTTPFLEREDIFLTHVFRIAIENSRKIKVIPALDVLDLLEEADSEKESLYIVLKALQTLDFEAKTAILLRDQLNLSDNQISAIMRISVRQARRTIIQARMELREKIQVILDNMRPPGR